MEQFVRDLKFSLIAGVMKGDHYMPPLAPGYSIEMKPESLAAYEFPDGEALADRLRGHGLIDVRWHPFTFGIATLYIGVKKPLFSGEPSASADACFLD